MESAARINCEQAEPAQRAAEYSPGWSAAEPGESGARYREPAQRATDTENQKWHWVRRPLAGFRKFRTSPGFRFAPPGAILHRLLRRLEHWQLIDSDPRSNHPYALATHSYPHYCTDVRMRGSDYLSIGVVLSIDSWGALSCGLMILAIRLDFGARRFCQAARIFLDVYRHRIYHSSHS